MTKALSKLTPRDRRHYQSLKQQIKDGLWAAIEATAQIHEEKLYLEEYATFDDFIAGELEYSRSRVYQMLKSLKGKAKLEMSTNVDILEANPSVAREVSGVPDDQIADVIERAKDDKGKVTAASVRKAKAELIIPIEPVIVTEEVYEDVVDDKPSKASPVSDDLGRPVPASLKAHQALKAPLLSLASELDAIRRKVDQFYDLPGGEFIERQKIRDQITSLKYDIAKAGYLTECPDCKGDHCGTCSGAGFIPARMKGQLSNEQKAWLGI